MNYMKIYNDLVNYAKSQVLPPNTYTEKHHIIMKSLGGTNDKSNLVVFTARQHYIAHLLLYKHYKQDVLLGKDKTPYYKSLGALSALIQLPASLDETGIAKRIFKFGSRLFESWKKDLAIRNSYINKKRIADLKQNNPKKFKEYCQNISNSCKKYIEENGSWWTGKHHSDKTRQKMKDFHVKNHPQAGEKNSQYGTIAIYNEETFERATQPKDQPIPKGWTKGRFYTATPEELKERKKLIDEILKLDPNSKVTIRMKLSKLQKIYEVILNQKVSIEKKELNSELKRIQKKQRIKEKIEILTKQYEFYNEYGWDKFVKKFNYQYSYPNFVQQCKKYVKEFVPQNGKKRGKIF